MLYLGQKRAMNISTVLNNSSTRYWEGNNVTEKRLERFVSMRDTLQRPPAKIADSFSYFVDLVSIFYQIEKKDIIGKSRHKLNYIGRIFVAMMLSSLHRFSSKYTGSLLGGRHHSTILHEFRKVNDLFDTYEDIALEYLELKNFLVEKRKWDCSIKTSCFVPREKILGCVKDIVEDFYGFKINNDTKKSPQEVAEASHAFIGIMCSQYLFDYKTIGFFLKKDRTNSNYSTGKFMDEILTLKSFQVDMQYLDAVLPVTDV